MKLKKKQILLVSFMLFSLFFGAGNLIFPPFLGQNAGSQTPLAIATFLITAVALPVLGVIVVAKFNGLEKLARKVNPTFAMIFTITIYLSIGPGLGIPRAASLPFEMAVAPYLPEGASFSLFMLLFSLVFFMVACWLALTPNKLVERIGKFLTPSLLCLILFLFINFLMRGTVDVVPAQDVAYTENALVKGFLEGYLTMDTIAALNFGLVIATTITSLGIKEKKGVMKYTVMTGIFAGSILAGVSLILAYMGMSSSGVFPVQENGAWTLRCIVHQLFGDTGAILLAAIFTLACLTTCVGLITSISQYFSTLTKKLSYRQWVFIIVGFSFLICNQGLSMILSISVPVLDAIYPISIMLIVLGLMENFIKNNPYIYPCTIGATGFLSIIYALEGIGVDFGTFGKMLHSLPLYSLGLGWALVAAIVMVLCVVAYGLKQLAGTSSNAVDSTEA